MWNPFKKKGDDDFDFDAPLPGEGKYPPGANEAFPPSPYDKQSSSPGMNDPFSSPSSMPPAPSTSDFGAPAQQQQPRFPEPEQIQPRHQSIGTRPNLGDSSSQNNLSNDKMEVMIAKLDSMRSMLDVISQRIANLEQRMNNEKRW